MRPPNRFKKVVLPATSRLQLNASNIGETVDTNAPFRNADYLRRQELDAAIAAEDQARQHVSYEVTCRCGEVFRAHNKRRRNCVRCSSSGGPRSEIRRSPSHRGGSSC